MPLPSPKARVPPKVTNIFDICFIYIYYIFYSCDNSPHLKHLLPPICICFWHRRYGGVFLCVFIFRRGDHRSPLPIFLSPPLSRFCRQLPSMGALQNASPWGEAARSDGVVVKKRRCLDVPFPIQQIRRGNHRSPIAYFSIAYPQSVLPTAPLYGSLTKCLSLRRGGTQWRSGGKK